MLSGDLLAFFTYASEILMALMMVAMVMMVLTRSIACGKRIVEVLEEQPEITDDDAVKEIADDGTERELTLSDGSIRFDHVYFKYHPDSAEWNLTDIDFSIASGMTVGILGGTGSAKSTLVSLIPRLYEATEGAVYVGGHNVKDYTMETLREGCAMVLQKNTLFSGTIQDNLRWGDENATDQGDGDRLPHGLRRRVHLPDARRLRHPHRAGRHQCLRRAEAAPVHCPCHSPQAQGADPGRFHLRRGHRYRRQDPCGAEGGAARLHQALLPSASPPLWTPT